MQIPDVHLEAMPDLAPRQLIGQLLNLIETLVAEHTALRVENQQLRDELARLKGASPKPEITPPVPPATTDHSSEAERQPPTPRGKPKPAKNATLTVTREQRCVVDPAPLPPDATRSGTTETIVQDVVLVPEVLRVVHEVWFVPSALPGKALGLNHCGESASRPPCGRRRAESPRGFCILHSYRPHRCGTARELPCGGSRSNCLARSG